MERQERPHANMEPADFADTKQSKQRASIKWLLSKAFNNRVPENLVEPFYRDHEDQEHLKPPIVGGLANAELYCLALANMYSDPNYHSLNHWNILQTLARKGVHVPDPPDCALTETVLIQTNPLRMSAHMAVVEALMVLYAREVVTPDRVSAAAQRFGTSQPPPAGPSVPHEDGILCWINAACAALNKAEEDSSQHVPMVSSLQDLCDGTALAALISFYCPDALPRAAVRVGRMASIQDCLHNLMLVHDFCQHCLPHNVFHMLPEDVTYMRGSMRQNLVAMLADLFNMLEVHPVKSVKYPGTACSRSNVHGVRHTRGLPPPPPTPIPDLRAGEPASPTPHHAKAFAVPRSPSARGVAYGRSACSTPERRSCSPQREEFVVHRGRQVTTLATIARQHDDAASVTSEPSAAAAVAAGRPSCRENSGSFAGRRSRRGSVSDDSQLTVENFGGSQDRLHFAGRNPEKELATVANVRKISAPAGPLDYNPPLRSSRQDIRGSIQFFHGDFQNGSQEEKPKMERQQSQPQTDSEQPYFPIRRQLSSDTISLNQLGFSYKGGGDGFFLNDRDATDGDGTKTSFADLNRIRSNGDQGVQSPFGKDGGGGGGGERRKTSFSTPPPNTTTWQQQFLQQENQPNGDELSDDGQAGGGGAMAAQLNNIRLKLEEKRRRIEHEKRRMELDVSRQRQQLGQQAFLQAVTRGKGARSPPHDAPPPEPRAAQEDAPNQTVDTVALEQYQQSIAKMNSSLQDIQSDIARLASQQSQIQQQQHQAQQLFQPPAPQPPPSPYQYQHQHQQQHQNLQHQMQHPHQLPPQQPNIPQLHSQFSSQHNVSRPALAAGFGSTPHLPRDLYQGPYYEPHLYQYRDMEPEPGRFYLHDAAPQRKTWAQHAQQQHQQQQQEAQERGWQLHQQNHQYQQPAAEPPQRSWKSPSPQPPERNWTPQGFVLHDRASQPFQVHYSTDRYQNGTENARDPQNHLSYTVINPNQYVSQSPPLAASPQRRAKTPQRQGSLPERRPDAVSLQQLQAPAPPDDMEPQNISFIGNAEDDALRQGINRLNISSGTRTYRIPSPTRPSLGRSSFQQPDDDANEKGFYISFDTDQPKRPKPPLRAKRMSPKKEKSELSPDRSPENTWNERVDRVDRVVSQEEEFVVHRANVEPLRAAPERRDAPEPAALVIGELNPDPTSAEEMERKKERIMLLSLQRRQRADEARARAEAAAAARRARDEAAAELKLSRKEEQARRRELILRQYKLKKAIEEAEREGKVLDKTEFLEALNSGGNPGTDRDRDRGGGGNTNTRLRSKAGAARARPKTIHVDSGALHQAEGLRAKQPSNTNLTAGGTMRRDYYRGSQDSLAERAGLYRVTPAESPVEERGGASPGSASSAPLGRRGSCKTSRGPRLYKQPTTKSNRGIMLNAVEYCVFPGAVNAEAKRRVLEEIARSESKHFLVLFRDAGCQFRALYSYCPDTDHVAKLYGTGPKNVNDRMFDKFFKYNSGSKCFSQVHTKHLTVTIDAFTIHNSLWQGKKVQLPSKKDMALVI